ncbi:ATP-binding protein [Beggiatoa leptomitoformis]|uniref:histidine kinase n=1 Tax=Beggiatoa leptomitoformis TaxID=288004 RepID=A0A2N9YFA6_9GAMM|nr:ATP-binding protein [Beggiatoa leptomitoformis]ALG68486.1 HAMP domain-containing protein [Beggiatoa leptomitoformis]AUI69178.1 HAMP domain-containing protein [Beggiatoa leptomitoformis]
MKFGLLAKLFLALLCSSTLVAIIMAISAHWSFQSGFTDYLHNAETERLTELRLALEAEYTKKGSWQFLQNNRNLWETLLNKHLGEEFQLPPLPQPRPFGEILHSLDPPLRPPAEINERESAFRPRLPDGNEREPPFRPRPPDEYRGEPPFRPPHHQGEGIVPLSPFALRPRLRLLTPDKKMIIGSPFTIEGNESLLPIYHNDKPVAWLAIHQMQIETNYLAASFLKQQTQTYYLTAVLGVLISALISLWLARQLLIPVQRITTAARHLGAGQYQTRVQVSSHDELGQLASDFNLLAHTLERNETARRQWIADISHELRTPLAILRGEIEAIQDGIRQFNAVALKSLHVEVLGLGKLVDDLYELALSDVGALDYRRETCNILILIEEVLDVFQTRFRQHQLQLINQTQTLTPIYCAVDVRRFMQLFHNLLENTVRYTDTGGSILITVAQMANRVIICLEDSPPNVPDEALPLLFERLYRVDKSRSRASGGAGLGLAICKNIVEAHGGTINAFHASLGGLGIRIELPLQPS